MQLYGACDKRIATGTLEFRISAGSEFGGVHVLNDWFFLLLVDASRLCQLELEGKGKTGLMFVLGLPVVLPRSGIICWVPGLLIKFKYHFFRPMVCVKCVKICNLLRQTPSKANRHAKTCHC